MKYYYTKREAVDVQMSEAFRRALAERKIGKVQSWPTSL
jgi:hypothetical protein